MKEGGTQDEQARKWEPSEYDQQQYRVLCNGTRAVCYVSRPVVTYLLSDAIMAPSDEERALLSVFCRMHGWMESLVCLEDPRNVQATSAAARSIFENWLELEKLTREPALAARFLALPKIEEHHGAKKFCNFLETNNLTSDHLYPKVKALAADPAYLKHLDDVARKHWGSPLGGVKSWWAKNISQRAAEIGLSEERYYRTAYFHYCRYVHSGPGGAGSANAQEVFHACGFAHLATQERFLKALDRICRKFHLYEANAKLGNIPCRIQEAVGFAGDYSKENLWCLQEELAKWGPTGQAPQ